MRNFVRTCWRCGEPYWTRYAERHRNGTGYFNDLCPACHAKHRRHHAKRPLNDMEREWVIVSSIHAKLYGPTWCGSAIGGLQ